MKVDILDRIIADKRIEVEARKKIISTSELIYELDQTEFKKLSMSSYLANSSSGIIAEFKRRSPSKGWIKEGADVSLITPLYENAGASAISILTDVSYFGGTLSDLKEARSLVTIPILRKDFVVDEYQLIEAKASGADAVLLIAAAITEEECSKFASMAHYLDMEVLLELHTETELGYINKYIDMVGVNNRNLGTFHTDIDNSFRLYDLLPSELVKVSESGIDCVETIRKLKKIGYQGFLIGEQFMKTESPSDSLYEFIKSI